MADPSAEWTSEFCEVIKSELEGAYTTQTKLDAAEMLVLSVNEGLKKAGNYDVHLELKEDKNGDMELVVAAKSYTSISSGTTP